MAGRQRRSPRWGSTSGIVSVCFGRLSCAGAVSLVTPLVTSSPQRRDDGSSERTRKIERSVTLSAIYEVSGGPRRRRTSGKAAGEGQTTLTSERDGVQLGELGVDESCGSPKPRPSRNH